MEQEILLNSIPALVYYKDLNSRYIAVKQTFADLTNTSRFEVVGKAERLIVLENLVKP